MKINKRLIKIVIILLMGILISLCISCGNTNQTTNKALYIIFNANGGEFSPGQSTYSLSVQQGDSIILPELPTREGYIFIDWYLNEELKDSDKLNVSLFRAVEGRTIFAKWESVDTYKHAITVSSNVNAIINIYINPKSSYPDIVSRASKGTQLILEIEITNPAYMLEKDSLKAVDNLSINQDILINEDSLVFEMPSYPITIISRFEKRPFNINIIGGDTLDGTVIVGSETAKQGENVTIFAIPDIGYKLENITILGTGELVTNNVFTMGAYDASLSVKFSKIDKYIYYPIVVDQVDFATIQCPKTSANAGEYIDIELQIDAGYYLDSLLLNGSRVGNYGFIMPESEAIITANLEEIDYDNKFKLSLMVKPESLNNDYVSIKDFDLEGYSAGERIELILDELGDYIIDSIAINGIYCSLDNIIMPNENGVLTVELSSRGNKINISPNNTIQIASSHEYAKIGEIVKIEILESLDGKILNLDYRREPNGDNYYSISECQFEMPDFPIIITAISASLGSEERSIDIQIAENGYLQIDNISYGYGFNEVVNAKIYPELGYSICKLFYINVERELSQENIVYIINTPEVRLEQDTIAFTMPNYNIKLYAEFKKYHSITAFEDDKIIVYPERELAFEGDAVYVYSYARNNYDYNSFTIIQNSVDLDVSGYFIMGNSDVTLNYFIKTNINQIQYDIVINSFLNGMIEGPNRAKVGSSVPLTIKPAKGYYLYSLKMKKSSDLDASAIEIIDTFIMPNFKVVILAEFRYKESYESFSLLNAYQDKKANYYNNFGIFFRLFDNLTSISSHFNASPKILNISAYIEAVLLGETQWGTSFYIIETNKPTLLNAIGQVFYDYFQFDNGENIDCQIFDGYITVSLGGLAEEDYLVVKNGLHLCENKYYLFEKFDGTYGVYKALSNNTYDIIPGSFKENNKISRIVSYLGKNAYSFNKNLKGIYLANIRTLANYSLNNLSLIKELDLTQITQIGRGVFSGTSKLSKVYIGVENNKYSIENGAVYSKNKQTLVLYPAGRPDSTFNVAFEVVGIYDYAFFKSINIQSLSFLGNKKINSIGDYAFWGCLSLSNMQVVAQNPTYPSTADLNNILSSHNSIIGDYSLANTPGLRRFNISSVDRIGNNALEWDGSIEFIVDISEKEDNYILSYLEPISINNESPLSFNLKILIHPTRIDDYYNDDYWKTYNYAFVS